MTMATSEGTERAALMRRLRAHVSDGFASAYENAPIEHLRIAVSDCDEQEEFYRLCGFEGMSLQEPTKGA
jgi:catechol-2,3-dioxygenase